MKTPALIAAVSGLLAAASVVTALPSDAASAHHAYSAKRDYALSTTSSRTLDSTGSTSGQSAGSTKSAPTNTGTTSSGPTYYVATSGSDSGSGQAGSPWRTIQWAVDHAPAASTINVGPGTFAGFDVTRPKLSIVGSGQGATTVVGSPTVPNTIGIDAVSTSVKALTLSGCTPADLSRNDYEWEGSSNIGVSSKGTNATISNVTIAGRSFTNSYGLDFGCFGIAARYVDGLTVTNSDISGVGSGVFIFFGGNGDVISGNAIHDDTVMIRNTPRPYEDFGGDGIGVDQSDTPRGVTISNNSIYNNSAPSHDYGVDGSALDLFGPHNVRITNNQAWNNVNIIETGSPDGSSTGCGNFTVSGNTFSGSPNTAYDSGVGMLLRCAANSSFTNNTLKNFNLFVFLLRPTTSTEQNNLTISGNRISQQDQAVFALSYNPQGHGLQVSGNTYAFTRNYAWDWNWHTIATVAAFDQMTGCTG